MIFGKGSAPYPFSGITLNCSMASISVKTKRTLFHLLLTLSFFIGIYFKQYSIFYPEPFVFLAFAGVLAILGDYAWRIRKESIMWLIPTLLGIELLGTLVSKAGLQDIATPLYVLGASLFLVYGILFIRKGILSRGEQQGLSWKFIILGLLIMPISGWELITYFPQDFEKSLLSWRILYLVGFAWLIFIDLTTNLKDKPGFKVERVILRYSLLVMAGMYFDRFIFQ